MVEAHGSKPKLPKPRALSSFGEAVTHGEVAQMFAAIAGVILACVGIVSLVVNASFATGSMLAAERFVLFDVNGWSGVLYLFVGFALLLSVTNAARARKLAIATGGLFLVLTVWSLFDSSILSLLPVNDPTAILYAALGVIGLTTGISPNRKHG